VAWHLRFPDVKDDAHRRDANRAPHHHAEKKHNPTHTFSFPVYSAYGQGTLSFFAPSFWNHYLNVIFWLLFDVSLSQGGFRKTRSIIKSFGGKHPVFFL
jgi:hypothetical protein